MSKTLQRPLSFSQSVTAEEETANAVVFTIVDITSGETTDDFLWVHQVQRAGVEIPGFEGTYSTSSGELTIADAGSADLTSGDIVNIIGTFVTLLAPRDPMTN